MWMATTRGFFSAVQHNTNPNLLVVRTRDRSDAESLKDWYQGWIEDTADSAVGDGRAPAEMPDATITTYEFSDYPWRVIMPRTAYAAFVLEAVVDLDYGNFKDAVKATQGPDRAGVYMNVWSALLRLEYLDPFGRNEPTWDDEPWDEYDAWEDTQEGAVWDDEDDEDDLVVENPTPAQVTAYVDRDALRCLTCGTDNAVRECPDWCPRMAGACTCGRSDCGECMRGLGTSTSGFGGGAR